MINILNFKDDIIEMILDIRCNQLYDEINDIYIKVKKLEAMLRPLCIDKADEINKYNWSNDEIYLISYDRVYYCMFKYLFNIIKGKIVLINLYNVDFGDNLGVDYISNILVDPTYLDILIEFNKSVIITGDVINFIYLEGLEKLNNSDLKNIKKKKHITYYRFITSC
tara:strand:+ start:1209 stop:1709 length:501 start_codon:yes stop_codon:yes gene_type:complete